MDCARCGWHNRPSSRFCRGCGAALSTGVRCPSCGQLVGLVQRFCHECGACLGGSDRAVRRPTREAAPREYTPPYLADRILRSRAALEGERKQVTILFADVRDSLAISDRLQAEAWHEILDTLFRILTGSVHRFEGTVNQYTGDGVMALFGAPLAHEDHAQRACLAALQIHSDLRELAERVEREHGVELGLRIGLNSGEVVVGKIGDDLRMDYTAQGAVVAIAKRAEELAPTGEIYLSESTARLVEGYVRLEERGPFEIRGLHREASLYRLVGLGVARTRLDAALMRGLTRFVGRVGEMAQLLGALEETATLGGRVVGVVGEAGVGKSRLCREFAAQCRDRGVPVRETRGLPDGRRFPLRPFLALLRSEFGIEEDDSDGVARARVEEAMQRIDPELGADAALMQTFLELAPRENPLPLLDPDDRQRALSALVLRILQARSRLGPVLLLIEDLQWLDPASARALDELVRSANDTRVLLLVNFRPDYRASWTKSEGYEEIELQGLWPSEVTEILRDLMGPEIAESELADELRDRASGNPLFLEEAVRVLLDAGSITGPRGRRRVARPLGAITIPPTTQALLQSRIDGLGEADKELLLTASVLARPFTRSLLAQIARADERSTGAALGRLTRKAFFKKQRGSRAKALYAFGHPLMQETAYAVQLAPRRARTHATVAETLSEDPAASPAELAHHFDMAGDVQEAVRWYRRAARWVETRDPKAAVRDLHRVCELLEAHPDLPDAAPLGLRARVSLFRVASAGVGLDEGEAEQLLATGRRLAEVCRDRVGQARLLELYGATRGYAGDLGQMLEYVSEAARVAEGTNDPELGGALFHRLSFAYVHTGRLRDGLALSMKRISEVRPADGSLPDPVGALAEVAPTLSLGLLLLGVGRYADADRELERAQQLAELAKLPDSFQLRPVLDLYATTVAWYRGDAEAASRHAAKLAHRAQRTHSTWENVLTQFCLGVARIMRGRGKVAAALLEAGLGLARESHVGLEGEAHFLALLSEAHLLARDEWRALATASEAVEVAQRRGTRWWEIRALRAKISALLAKEGTVAEAEIARLLERAFDLVSETGAAGEAPFLHALQAERARACGDVETAVRETAEARRLFRRAGAPARAEALAS